MKLRRGLGFFLLGSGAVLQTSQWINYQAHGEIDGAVSTLGMILTVAGIYQVHKATKEKG